MSRTTSTIVLFLLIFLTLSILSIIVVEKASGSGKIDPLLMEAVNLAVPQTTGAAGERPGGLVRFNEAGHVQVYVHYDPSLAGPDLSNVLRELGMTVELIDSGIGVIQGWLSPDFLDEMAALPFVTRISRPSYGTLRTGNFSSEGVSILNADDLHGSGILGSGITVGVISDGADSWTAAQATGDLPAVFSTGTCTSPTSCDEGTAMLEIVYDITPGADLVFCAGLNTTLEFRNCLAYLGSYGVDVIVDDVVFYEEPYFSDGIVAQEIQAIASSIVYVTSAGNDAQNHYETSHEGAVRHDFGMAAGMVSDEYMDVILGPDEKPLSIYLQWNEPFGASFHDMDLILYDNNEVSILTSSRNLPGGDPLEMINYSNNTGTTQTVKLVIENHGIIMEVIHEIFIKGESIQNIEYVDGSGSIIGHAAVPGVMTVGAVDAAAPTTIELFSSQGPSKIGTFIPTARQKPDVVAVDDVTVSGVGGFGSPFSGTSAAAPHVAGIAALLLSAEPLASVSEIFDALTGSAADLGDSGFDPVYGYGRVDALAAYNRLTSNGGGGGGCFIATTAYGSTNHPAVTVLRRFKDEVLMELPTGRAFVRSYYRYSPQVAQWMEGNRWTGPLVRMLLFPVVLMVWILLNPGWLLILLVLVSVYTTVARRRNGCRTET